MKELSQKKTTIILGDLNVAHKEIDIKNPKINQKTSGFTKEERKEFDNFLEKGFIDTWRKKNPKKIQYSW